MIADGPIAEPAGTEPRSLATEGHTMRTWILVSDDDSLAVPNGDSATFDFSSASTQRVGGPGPMQAGPPQRFIGVDIADASDKALVHQELLDRKSVV